MNKWLTTKQVSTLTGYSVGTLYNLKSQRRGPKAYKSRQGRALRYKESEVLDWMKLHDILRGG